MSPAGAGVHPELQCRTPAAWAEGMLGHLDELLLEQVYLEKKAAAAATTFLFRLPHDPAVQRSLSALAREELLHFERALRMLDARGIALREQEPGPYAGRLKGVLSRDLPDRLLDELLVSAAIEARSHERMGLLAGALRGRDPELARFYLELSQAEARHGPDYLEAALASFPRAQVAERWQAVVAHEARVLRALPWLPRLHGGAGQAAGMAAQGAP